MISSYSRYFAVLLSIATMTIDGVNGYAIAQEPFTTMKPSSSTTTLVPPPQIDDTTSSIRTTARPNYNDARFLSKRTRRTREPFVGEILQEKREATLPASTTATAYDLGLGKNKPVVQKRRQQESTMLPTTKATTMEEVLMHWNQYEAVRDFPSPYDRTEVQYETAAKQSPPQRKMMPINPIRFVEDSLPIVAANNNNNQQNHHHHHHQQQQRPSTSLPQSTSHAPQPVMVHANKSQKLDVNTAWVEMLIHSEQRKFATAAQPAN